MPLMDQSNSDLNACQKMSQKLGENITNCQNNVLTWKKIYILGAKIVTFLSCNFVKDLVEL